MQLSKSRFGSQLKMFLPSAQEWKVGAGAALRKVLISGSECLTYLVNHATEILFRFLSIGSIPTLAASVKWLLP